MRGWSSVWLVTSLALLTSCGGLIRQPAPHARFPAEQLDRVFTRGELDADLTMLRSALEEVHPDPYWHFAKPDFAAECERVLATHVAGATRLEFHKQIAQLVALLDDGHTRVGFPQEEFDRHLSSGGKLLPFELETRDHAYYVSRVFGDDTRIEPGTQVIALNGEPIEDVLAAMTRFLSGPTQLRRADATRNFRPFYWLYRAGTSPVTMRLRAPSAAAASEIVDLELELVSRGAKSRRGAPGVVGPGREPYAFAFLADGAGFLDFRSMQDPPRFSAFLAEVFGRLRDARAPGFIVDLRRNGGGDSRLGEELLSYITDKPYRMTSRKEWKVSRRYRSFLKSRLHPLIRWLPLQYFHPLGRQMWGTPEGESMVFEGTARAATKREPHFSGPVVFLIGRDTFSSALILANAVEDFQLATLIGEPTAESANSFGELYWFDLPHTGLQVNISSARFVRANGDATAQGGVVPDIVVAPDATSVAIGADPVLDRARAWIKEEVERRGSTAKKNMDSHPRAKFEGGYPGGGVGESAARVPR